MHMLSKKLRIMCLRVQYFYLDCLQLSTDPHVTTYVYIGSLNDY